MLLEHGSNCQQLQSCGYFKFKAATHTHTQCFVQFTPCNVHICSVVTAHAWVKLRNVQSYLKMAVFWIVVPCRLLWVYQRFRRLYCLHHQGDLMMEAVQTSETLVYLYQCTRCHNPEDSHLRTHGRENLKLYSILFVIMNEIWFIMIFYFAVAGL
jgi:hypothetical protein